MWPPLRVRCWPRTVTEPPTELGIRVVKGHVALRRLGLVGLLLLSVAGCDHGLAPGPTGITGMAGRLEFVGPWPPQIGEVAVAVYQHHPRELSDFLRLSGYDTGITVGAVTQEYQVELQVEGTYDWVIVAWRPLDSFWDFTSLLGCYHASGDILPTAVPVTLGQITPGIDITVDFSILEDGAREELDLCSGALSPEVLDEAGF